MNKANPSTRDENNVPDAEVEEGKILVAMEALNLSDECKVDKRIWEPLFGGELTKLWDSVLVNEGDEIIIKGSSVIRMVFGGYSIDAATHLAPTSLRSDIDIVYTQNEMLERAKLAYQSKTEGVSDKISIDKLEVGFISNEKVRTLSLEALDQLQEWASKLTPENSDYFTKRISYTEELYTKTDAKQMLELENYLPFESLGLRLTRNANGELDATLIDAAHILEDPQIRNGLQMEVELGQYYGAAFPKPNIISLNYLLLEAFSTTDGEEKPTFNSVMPLWAIKVLPRVIRAACELDMAIDDSAPFHQFLYTVAERLVKGEELFKLTGETAEDLKRKEFETPNEYFEAKTKEAFARACATNPVEALDFMLLKFPLAELLSEEFGKVFEEVHQENIPNNKISYYLRINDVNPSNLSEYLEAVGLNTAQAEALEKALKTFLIATGILGSRYKGRAVQMHTLSQNEGEQAELIFPHDEVPPQNMSEIMAALFVSFGWNKDQDIAKIREVIKNWGIAGIQKAYWKTTEVEFDTALDEEKILALMDEMKDIEIK